MLGRIIRSSIRGNKTQKLLSFFTIFLATLLVSSMLNITLGIADEVAKELRSYGSNIIVLPKGNSLSVEVGSKTYQPLKNEAFLDEKNIYTIKEIFWRNNITGFAPFLDGKTLFNKSKEVQIVGTYFNKNVPIDGELDYSTGVLSIYLFWKVEGEWLKDDSLDEVNVGRDFATENNLKVGDYIVLGGGGGAVDNWGRDVARKVKIVGIADFTGDFSKKIITSLKLAQSLLHREGEYSRAEVSAFTIPENDLAQKARRDRDSLNALEFDKWYCTAYVSSIAYQIEEDYKGVTAKALSKVADAESSVVAKIQSLMGVVSIIALLVASIAIAALMMSELQRRKKEIGLLKALGANNFQIFLIFATESVLIAIVASVVGCIFGYVASEVIAYSIFSHFIEISFVIIPICMAFAVLIAVFGSLIPMRGVVKLLPAEVLYGRQ